MRIIKYTFEKGKDIQVFTMPEYATVLSVQLQNNDLVIWARVYDEAPVVKRTFQICYTGKEYNVLELDRIYIGTVQYGDMVLHIFEHFNK